MSQYEETDISNDIAIIGMNGRFPGAKNTDEFWKNLYNGVESVRFFSRDELIKMGIDEHLLDNPRFVPADAILEDMDKFDAEFFDYSAREAEIMDPQHRMFLESAWELMEQAGYCADHYAGKIAVYAGANLSGYMVRNLYSNPGLVEKLGTFKIMIANGQDFLATKVSYKMDFTGPSVNVNTLCSSSMVALHYACQELLSYGSDIAIAGGVSFQVSRNEAFFYQEGGIGSADGHCRAFDVNANGTVSGSGLAMVVLKRMEDAIRDGDQIYAVVKGTGINNDGSNKNSFTAPNVDGQAECIAQAIAMSGVDPETVSYIDAHGTGTNLGDPIEIAALTKAYRAYTDKKQFCAIGSAKTNIGHLVNAGGMASLVKTVLALNHKVIPASLNFSEPNPKIDFLNSPFYVNAKRRPWECEEGKRRRGGVSSFGIGGTNVHAILEEAPQVLPSKVSNRPCQMICLSAKTETALLKMTENLLKYLKQNPNVNLADVAFTFQVGRRQFNHKKVIIAANVNEAIEALEQNDPSCVVTNHEKPKDMQAVVILEEGGAYEESAKKLCEIEPVFCEAYQSLGEIQWKEQAMFAYFYAMIQLLKSYQIVVAGYIASENSMYAVACFDGIITKEQAMDYLNKGTHIQESGIDRTKLSLMTKESVTSDSSLYAFPMASTYRELVMELANYWMSWGRIDWNAFYEGCKEQRHRIKLPTYPFERQRYWIEPGKVGTNETEVSVDSLKKKPRPQMDTPYVAPRDEIEEAIAHKWEEVLGFEQVGIHDNFFELGGHSLIAAAVANDLGKKFDVQIPMRTLFEATTISEIAELIKTYQWASMSESTEADDDFESGSI